MNWRDYITVDPAICHGRACVKGTRVMASVVLDNLAQGASIEDLLASYPSLSREGILATMGYAAELSRDRTDDLSPAGPS